MDGVSFAGKIVKLTDFNVAEMNAYRRKQLCYNQPDNITFN